MPHACLQKEVTVINKNGCALNHTYYHSYMRTYIHPCRIRTDNIEKANATND